LCSGEDAARVDAQLKAVGLPTRMGDIPGLDAGPGDILAAMRQDKKVERGRLTLILARGIGESFVAANVDGASVSAFLARELALSA
jgi:3-dehydroquinate synthetase